MKKLFLLAMVFVLSIVVVACKEEPLEEVSLTVWASELDQTLTRTLVDEFIADHADEVILTVEVGPLSESQAADTVLADIDAAADIFSFADDQFNRLMEAGALQEIVENTAAVIAANGGANSGSILAGSSDGDLYAYPMTADNGYFLFYDSSVYSASDVATLDGILTRAAADGSQFTMQINNGWYLYSFFQGAGLSLTYDGTVNTANWDNATGSKVTEAIIAMAEHDGYVNMTDAEFSAGVTAGTITAGINGVWNATVAETAWGDNYAATKLPTYTLDGVQTQMASFAGYKLVGVNQTTDNPYWAMMLAEYLTSEDAQVRRFGVQSWGPSNVNAAQSTEVQANPAIAALALQSQFATIQNVGGNYWSPTESFGNNIVDGTLTSSSTPAEIQAALVAMVEGVEAAPAA